MKKKALLFVLAAALLIVASVGGTLAWLSAQTDTIENTFTVGNVTLDLYEHTLNSDGKTLTTTQTKDGNEYHLVPGVTYGKDPTLVVKANSEECYLFFKVEVASTLSGKLSYTLNTTGWTALTSETGVYYRVVSKSTTDQSFSLLTNNQISVASSVEDLAGIGATDALSFTGYAIQKEGMTDAADAWSKI